MEAKEKKRLNNEKRVSAFFKGKKSATVSGFCHESGAIVNYLLDGYNVYRTVVDNHEVDFIIEKDGIKTRVDATRAEFTSQRRDKLYIKPHKRKNLMEDKVDVIASVILNPLGSMFSVQVIETTKADLMPKLLPVIYLPTACFRTELQVHPDPQG